MSETLDNLIWHAVNEAPPTLRELSPDGQAGRYRPEVAPFCALGDATPSAWRSLAALMAPGSFGMVFHRDVTEVPAAIVDDHDLRTFGTETATQYIADDLDPPPELDLVRLGPDDLDDIDELIEMTRPGPFGKRTLEMGTYRGLRDDGALVAMAGERMRCEGWVEVSAVCVHPSRQRLGLGAALTLAVAHGIRADGHEAILHVREGNDPAHALYRRIGFRPRAEFNGIAFATPRPS